MISYRMRHKNFSKMATIAVTWVTLSFLALVNVLSQPVTIFTSAENMPVVTLMPISSIVDSSIFPSIQPKWIWPLRRSISHRPTGGKRIHPTNNKMHVWKKFNKRCVVCLLHVSLQHKMSLF